MNEIIIQEGSRQYLLSCVTDEKVLKSVCNLRLKVCYHEMGLDIGVSAENLLDQFEDVKNGNIKLYCIFYNDKLIGSTKITNNYNFMQWENIFLDFKNNLNDEKVAEGSFLAFEKNYRFGLSPILMAFAISDLFYNDYRYIYIQSKENTLNYYKHYGFGIVGNDFRIVGWKGNWYPMVMDIREKKEKFIKDEDNFAPMVKKFWRYFFYFLKEFNKDV